MAYYYDDKNIESFHFVIPSDQMELKQRIKTLEQQLLLSKKEIPKLEKQLEILKQENEERNWMSTNHEKVFDGLEISANFNTWEQTKKRYKNDNSIGAFYYGDKDSVSDDGLTVYDAKELIKYLKQKIDYLEAE